MYKLINKQTGEEHLCEKVVVDGWDYYVSDEEIKDVRPHKGKWQVEKGYILNQFPTYLTDLSECKLVIATNNPNIDIPQVVDEVEELAEKIIPNLIRRQYVKIGFIAGYNKSQETHPNSDDDMVEFADWCETNYDDLKPYTIKELLQLWKEQKTKTLYYET